MNLTGNTILITGGGRGIGLELAKELLARSNKVLICGRREEVLAKASHANSGLQCHIEKRGQMDRGILASEVAKAVLGGMASDTLEIPVGLATNLVNATRTPNFDQIFGRMNARRN